MGGMFSRLSAATVVSPPLCAGYSSKAEMLMINATSSNSDVNRHLETSRELYPRMSAPWRLPCSFVASPKRNVYG